MARLILGKVCWLRKTLVIVIRNEEKYLPYCLASLWNAPVDEFIFVLDRCTDGSEKVVKHFVPDI